MTSAISRLRNSIKFDSGHAAFEDMNHSSFLRKQQSFGDDINSNDDNDGEDTSAANTTRETRSSTTTTTSTTTTLEKMAAAATISNKLESDKDVSTELSRHPEESYAVQAVTESSRRHPNKRHKQKGDTHHHPAAVTSSPSPRKSRTQSRHYHHRGSKKLQQIKDAVTQMVSSSREAASHHSSGGPAPTSKYSHLAGLLHFPRPLSSTGLLAAKDDDDSNQKNGHDRPRLGRPGSLPDLRPSSEGLVSSAAVMPKLEQAIQVRNLTMRRHSYGSHPGGRNTAGAGPSPEKRIDAPPGSERHEKGRESSHVDSRQPVRHEKKIGEGHRKGRSSSVDARILPRHETIGEGQRKFSHMPAANQEIQGAGHGRKGRSGSVDSRMPTKQEIQGDGHRTARSSSVDGRMPKYEKIADEHKTSRGSSVELCKPRHSQTAAMEGTNSAVVSPRRKKESTTKKIRTSIRSPERRKAPEKKRRSSQRSPVPMKEISCREESPEPPKTPMKKRTHSSKSPKKQAEKAKVEGIGCVVDAPGTPKRTSTKKKKTRTSTKTKESNTVLILVEEGICSMESPNPKWESATEALRSESTRKALKPPLKDTKQIVLQDPERKEGRDSIKNEMKSSKSSRKDNGRDRPTKQRSKTDVLSSSSRHGGRQRRRGSVTQRGMSNSDPTQKRSRHTSTTRARRSKSRSRRSRSVVANPIKRQQNGEKLRKSDGNQLDDSQVSMNSHGDSSSHFLSSSGPTSRLNRSSQHGSAASPMRSGVDSLRSDRTIAHDRRQGANSKQRRGTYGALLSSPPPQSTPANISKPTITGSTFDTVTKNRLAVKAKDNDWQDFRRSPQGGTADPNHNSSFSSLLSPHRTSRSFQPDHAQVDPCHLTMAT